MTYSESVRAIAPARLYKYRSCDLGIESGARYERDRAIIQKNMMWASPPTDFNDPYDCTPTIDLSGTPDERYNYAKRIASQQSVGKPRSERRRREAELIKNLKSGFWITMEQSTKAWSDSVASLGVICLAERADDMLMWGYYSNGHRGYCLEFETEEEPFSRAHRVVYNAERPVFRPLDPHRSELMERVLLRKADFWRHEHEWRVISSAVGAAEFPPEALKAIILGANISREHEQALRQLVRARSLPVEFRRARLDAKAFRLAVHAA